MPGHPERRGKGGKGGGGDDVLFSHEQETRNVHNEMGDWTLWEDIVKLEGGGGGGEKAQSRKIRNRRCTVAREERRRRQKKFPPYFQSQAKLSRHRLFRRKKTRPEGQLRKANVISL